MASKTIIQQLSQPLEIENVDFRIQSISQSGWVTVLAYKDARVDMNRLDSVVGENWQCEYQTIDGQLFCKIGIKFDNEWIWRQDVGTESNTEKEKGRASDAFKRAGFRWGIGRELYDYPRIFFQLHPNEFKVQEPQNGQGKKRIYASFDLKLDQWTWEVEFNDNKPVKLVGKDTNGIVRFDSTQNFNGIQKPQQQNQQQQTQAPAKKKMAPTTYEKAVKSDKIDSLTKALTTYDLTPEQLAGISGRIAELKGNDGGKN